MSTETVLDLQLGWDDISAWIFVLVMLIMFAGFMVAIWRDSLKSQAYRQADSEAREREAEARKQECPGCGTKVEPYLIRDWKFKEAFAT